MHSSDEMLATRDTHIILLSFALMVHMANLLLFMLIHTSKPLPPSCSFDPLPQNMIYDFQFSVTPMAKIL